MGNDFGHWSAVTVTEKKKETAKFFKDTAMNPVRNNNITIIIIPNCVLYVKYYDLKVIFSFACFITGIIFNKIGIYVCYYSSKIVSGGAQQKHVSNK